MDDHISDVPLLRLNNVNFRLYTTSEIKALSVLEVTNPQTFDILSHPTYGGLHDPALGPSDRHDVCITCGLSHFFCPGHFGHIQLPLPAFHPVYFLRMLQLLKGTCFDCHKLKVDEFKSKVFQQQTALLDSGDIRGCYAVGVYAKYLEAERGHQKYSLVPLFEEYIKANYEVSDEERKNVVNFKNLEAARTDLIKEMLTYMIAQSSCPHCGEKRRKLDHKYCRSVNLYGKPKKKTAKQPKKQKKKKKKTDDDAEDEDENEDGFEEHVEAQVPSDEEKEKDFDNFANAVSDSFTYLTASLVREHIREVWKTGEAVLKILFSSLSGVSDGSHPTDIFFLDVLPVSPPRFRPVSELHGRKYANSQTVSLAEIVQDKIDIVRIIQEMNKKKIDYGSPEKTDDSTLTKKLNETLMRMQTHINCIMDSGFNVMNETPSLGIKQLLEKKAGLFRMNMMGKRVNYAARSVISPDPCINVNEIGVPLVFAKSLTYPQAITPLNYQELQQMVLNGPNNHPGANMVEMENGRRVKLTDDHKHCEAIAKQLLTPPSTTRMFLKPKIVYRHLKNGDYMLLNRQPTLHKPSIQAHRVRVLPGQKTLRLHYANCKAYNADFDGDEMNAHFPQNELGRAEAMKVAATDYQYLVPKDGTPLAGLIQDHMVSGVMLTIRGRFLSRDDYFQLLYATLTDTHGPVKSLPPAIVKPLPLWSGKQVLSSVLLNLIPAGQKLLNLEGKSKVPEKNWMFAGDGGTNSIGLDDLGESKVIIRDGELLQGVLDKAHYGPTSFGIVHSCYELYGGQVAGKLLSCLGKLFRAFLQMRGFTLGVEDILVKSGAEKKRKKVIEESPSCGSKAIRRALNVSQDDSEGVLMDRMRDAHYGTDDAGLCEQDLAMKIETDKIQNNIVKECIPNGLLKPFPYNNLQLMVEAGAKGSSVNCMQISCLLGQIELEGRRPPLMESGRTLPSFVPYDTAPRAGGFVAGRFLTGIKPPEYFFHCMAGREGLVDTAVKTSRSGYLQRCIVKHLEGVQVTYDMTVRDSDGSVIQFCYGEDGLETTKTAFLAQKQFPFWMWNDVSKDTKEEDWDSDIKKKIKKLNKKIGTWKKRNRGSVNVRQSNFLQFCADYEERNESGSRTSSEDLKAAWNNLQPEEKQVYKRPLMCPDPVLSHYLPLQHPAAISEKLKESIESFCDASFKNTLQSLPSNRHMTARSFQRLLSKRVMQAFAHPGENVGLTCAQSIGEPSTQMTLNTFHFAGRGEMNVTLGIPRLRELLQNAPVTIRTPAMDIPVLQGAEDQAKQLKIKLAKVPLSKVLKDVHVTESIAVLKGRVYATQRNFRVRFNFLPENLYKEKYCVTPKDILVYMEVTYLQQLLTMLRGKMKNTSALSTVMTKRPTMPKDVTDEPSIRQNDESSDEEPNDGDAATVKELSRHADNQEYDDQEQEEQPESDESSDYDSEGMEDDKGAVDEDGSSHQMKTRRTKVATQISAENVLNKNITEYCYDKKEFLWCEAVYTFDLFRSKVDVLTVVQDSLKSAVVHQVEGIQQTFLVEEKGESGPELHLKTEGVNIQEMYKYSDILDLNKLYTNDVRAFADVYGIEAASRILLKEISTVFGGYGISVDYRHLSLLKDYMTFEGSYKGLNRATLTNNVAPFQKMTFETCMKFLTDSSIYGNQDALKSPSSCIVTGQVVKGGTGAFQIMQKLV